MAIATINPATGKTLRTFDPYGWERVDSMLSRARSAFEAHRLTSFAERKEKMTNVAELLEERSDEYGAPLTLEMGKTLKSAIAEVKKCANACRFYAEHAEELLKAEDANTDAARSFVVYQPLGVILAVMPWNFPFWQVFRFAAPTIMAGNVAVLKHASNVPQSALAIERIFHDAGFSEGIFQTLLIGSDLVARVLEDDRVAGVSLTGSEAAGSSVAATAGKVIKPAVLELGGSDPFIVMPSADLDRAAEVAVTARTMNNGQSCIAAKRFIVHRDVAEAFTAKFVEQMKALKVGDPNEESTDIGPLATPQIVDDLEKQVNDSVAAGARVLCGGRRIEGNGNFFEATILTDIPDGAPAENEELFGPVASLFVVDDITAAITRANATRFGLGSSVWTNDEAERRHFIAGIDAGQVFINAMVASNPLVPFGGVKKSGYGRELGVQGIREFVNVKTVWIEDARKNASE